MKIKVVVMESESGWGQKVAFVKEFTDANEAHKFYIKINEKLGKQANTPSYYQFALPPTVG